MAQRGHVPRFGDWNENAAYTTYFEVARKGKAAGTNIVNPNDPQQSPELHKPGAFAAEPHHHKKGHWDRPVEYNAAHQHHIASYSREEREFEGYGQTPPRSRNGNQRAYMDEQGWNQEREFEGYAKTPPHYKNGNQGAYMDQQGRIQEREFEGYAKTPPHYKNSNQRANMDQQGRNRAGRRRSSSDALHAPSSSSASPITHGRAANARHSTGTPGHHRPVTVPKFGEWDAADPNASGGGYTVIFNQVKEDKKAAATHLPPVLVQRTPSPVERQHHHDSRWTGLFQCLRPNVRY